MEQPLKLHENKLDNNLSGVMLMKKYYIQKHEDYTTYSVLSGQIRSIANKIKDTDAEKNLGTVSSARLLEMLYQKGLIPTRWDLAHALNMSAISFCKRRLAVVMVRNKMSENLKEATKMIEQGRVRVGAKVVKNPSFLVARAFEDSLTLVDSSAI